MRDMLTQEKVHAYHRDGFVVLQNCYGLETALASLRKFFL